MKANPAVAATLGLLADAGKRTRCRLHQIAPSPGMTGGGEGECRLQGGGVVDAA